MTKRMIIMLISAFIVFGGVFGWKAVQSYFIGQYFAHYTPPPETVSASSARTETWQPTLSAVGNITAVNGVELSPEVPGVIERFAFESGQVVKKGDLLIQLDDSGDKADLAGLKAQLELARINYARQQTLRKQKLGSPSDLDTARTLLRQAEANVVSKETVIAKKAIRAPFAGRLGIRKVNLGQYVAPGTPLVSLQSVDPVYVDFALPEQHIHEVHAGQTVRVSVDAFPGEVFTGKITAVDAEVDPRTRNLSLQATLDNPQQRLQPGMFAAVKVLLPAQEQVVTLPRTAISYSLYGKSVYVIEERPAKKDDKNDAPVLVARQRFVETGQERGKEVAIVRGVKAGERVVTAGQLKLHDGAHVRIDNSVKLD